MPTIGDIIAQGYGTGRQIGNDWSQTRFTRGAQRIRDEYTQRAADEGKQLEDYLPEMEEQLRSLYTSSGAARRGVTDRYGHSLDEGAGEQLRADLGRMGERRAGALALAGDQQGARMARAGTQYGLGDFDAGQGQQIAADTIGATRGALGADGQYNMAKGAQALAGVGARYGDAGQANAQQQGATTFRLQDAVAKADSLARMVQNVDQFSNDQIRGTFAGLKESVPELSRFDLQKGDDGKIYYYTNEGTEQAPKWVAQGDLTPEETMQMLSQFTAAPGQTLQTFQAARLKAITDEKTRTQEVDKTYRDAMIKAVDGLKAEGMPERVATAIAGASEKIGGGWQLQDIGSEPGSFIMQKDGNSYIVKTNVADDPVAGVKGGTVVVTDMEGRPLPGTVLDRGTQQSMASTLTDVAAQLASTNYKLQTGVLRDKLQLLNEMRNQDLGLTGRTGRGALGSKKGALPPEGPVKDAITNAAKKYGVPLEFAYALAQQESGYNPNAKNDEYGAAGLYQYIPGTAKQQGIDPLNAEQAADAAMRQFASRMKSGGVEEAIKAHFAGDGGGNRGEKTAQYLQDVMGRVADIRQQLGTDNGPGAPRAQSATASSTPTPTNPQRGVAAAASAPTARTALPKRAGISPDYVRGAAGELRTQASQLQNKEAALARFDKDMGTQLQQVPGPTNASLPRQAATNLTPEQQRVRDRLVADVETSRASLLDAERELRANTGALRRSAATSQSDKSADELYAKYGGAADFFRAAGSP